MNTTVLLDISFDGKHFMGWESSQLEKRTLSTVLTDALWKVLRNEIVLSSCSTLISGCHALHFFVICKNVTSLPENFLHKLNRCLPDDISARNFNLLNDLEIRVTRVFYEYYIHFQKQPFLENRSFFMDWDETLFENMKCRATEILKTIDSESSIQLQVNDCQAIIKIDSVDLTAQKALQTISKIINSELILPAYGLYISNVSFSEIPIQTVESEYFFITEPKNIYNNRKLEAWKM